MTNNIIKFPTEDTVRKRLKFQMNELIVHLDSLYADIDACLAEMCDLEDKVAKVEQSYNQVLRSYAQHSTTTSLEARYLAYCTHAEVHWDGDTNTLSFKLPPFNDEEQ